MLIFVSEGVAAFGLAQAEMSVADQAKARGEAIDKISDAAKLPQGAIEVRAMPVYRRYSLRRWWRNDRPNVLYDTWVEAPVLSTNCRPIHTSIDSCVILAGCRFLPVF